MFSIVHLVGAKKFAKAFTSLSVLVIGLILVTAGFVPSCVNKQQSANTRWVEIIHNGRATTPIVTMTFHGDTRFSQRERVAIEAGFRDIEKTSCDLVKLTLIWDFDPLNDFYAITLLNYNFVMYETSSDMILALGPKGDDYLGLTRFGTSSWIFLVMDKMGDNDLLLEWTTAHELSHAIGMMEHVNYGLMEPRAPTYVVDIAWKDDDVDEFCEVWDCDPRLFDSCQYR